MRQSQQRCRDGLSWWTDSSNSATFTIVIISIKSIFFFHEESASGAGKAHMLYVRLPGWQAATVPLLISVPAHETHLTQNLFQLLQLFLACTEIS